MGSVRLRTFRVIAVLCLITCTAAAQTAGTAALAGTVRDSSGAAVPDAAVDLTDVARGLRRTTQANAEGAFLFPGITPGAYQLRVTKEGFEAQDIRNITLEVGQRAAFDIELKPGQVRQ